MFSFWLGAAALTAIGSTALAIMTGAVVAAPLAAFAIQHLPGRLLAGAVGVTLIAINIPSILSLLNRFL